MRKLALLCALALCLTLTGCTDALLERTYTSSTPHTAAYWESGDADTLRAENYQDLVNALLLLLGEHSEGGVVRIYGDAPDKAAMAGRACVEVQKDTPIGAYLLEYTTYAGKAESAYYELTVRFGYRRTQEEQKAIVNASGAEALPELLRAAVRDRRGTLAVRFGYLGTARGDVMALLAAVHEEYYPAPEQPGEAAEPSEEAGRPTRLRDLAPWKVTFYPDERPGIVEIVLNGE